MPNLKDIRRRIKSVKNTQKITQAMRMVAAAKVKRAETKVKNIRPYSEQLVTMVGEVAQAAQGQLDGHPVQQWLTPKATIQQPAIVVVSSDRGLCGAFNGSIIRQAIKLDAQLREQGLQPKFYAVGRKVATALTKRFPERVISQMSGMTAAPSSTDAKTVINELSRLYEAGDIDDIVVLSTHFRSMVSYKVLLTSLIPGCQQPCHQVYPEHLISEKSAVAASTSNSESLIEPDPATVLESLIPLYLTTQLYTLLLESSASELAARMMAMANATSNAGDMIGKLSIQYNKLRQAAITQEILEIVGGAQALA